MSKNNPITISSWSLGDQWYTVNHKYPRIFLTAASGGRFTHLLFLFCSDSCSDHGSRSSIKR